MKAVLLSTALLCAAFAHDSAADPAAWHVTGENGGELWLLGSMHYLRADDYPLPASIEQLYDRADTLVMELDLDAADPLQQQATLLNAAVLPQGTTLRDVLDADVYRQAEAGARRLGVDLAQLTNFEPWLVAITLLDHGMSKLGYHADRGLEQYLLGKAHADGKEILGLESIEAQLGIFDDLPRADQQALLEQTLQELDSPEASMRQLAAAWRDGSMNTLTDELLEDFADFPGLYAKLVTNRNEHWVAPLEGMLRKRGKYLVVVGALHLVGRDSVVELLQARGYTVTRVE